MFNKMYADDDEEMINLNKCGIFYLAKILLIFPFSMGGGLKVECSSCLLSFLLIVVQVQVFIARSSYLVQTESSNTNILIYTSSALINLIVHLVFIIAPFLHRDATANVLRDLAHVDRCVKGFNLQGKNLVENTAWRKQLCQTLFTLAITFSFILLYALAKKENRFPSFSAIQEFYIIIVSWVLVFQIDFNMSHIYTRFLFVNHQMKKNIRMHYSNDGEPTFTRESLLNLNHIHFSLYKVFDDLNKLYSAQLMVMVPRAILFSVLPVHYNVVTALIKNPDDSSQLLTHVFTIAFVALTICPIVYAVHTVTRTVEEGKKMVLLTHDLIDEDYDTTIEQELLIISIELLHRNIEFSAQKFFVLRPSLISSMCELIITYVIILMQFQDTLSSVSPIQILFRPYNDQNNVTRNSTKYLVIFDALNTFISQIED